MMENYRDIQVPCKQFEDGMHKEQLNFFRLFDSNLARYFILLWHRRARKTTLAINLLIRECIKFPKSRYGYITHTYTAAKNIVWRDPKMLRAYLPEPFVKRQNESELFVEFSNGSILSIHGGDNPDAIKGIDFNGFVMDEAALCKRELYEESLRPIMAQDNKRWVLFITTPKGKNWIHEYWVKAKTSTDWQTNMLDVWTSGIIPVDEINKAKLEMPAITFAQEFECAFNDNASSVFKNVETCVAGILQPAIPNKRYVTGIDLARYQDFTVLITMDRDTRKVVDFQRYGNTEWSFQKDMIVETCNRYNSLAVVDATGVGDPICEDLKRRGLSILPYKLTNESKKEIIKRLQLAIEQRLLTFPQVDVLVDELQTYAYDVTDFGNIRFNAPEGMHDDCVIALALAVHGLKSDIYPKKERKEEKLPPFLRNKLQSKEYENAGFSYAT